jgi:hypothetical protein
VGDFGADGAAGGRIQGRGVNGGIVPRPYEWVREF